MDQHPVIAAFLRAMRPPGENTVDTAHDLSTLRVTGNGALPSVYPVTELAVATIATAAHALSDYMGQQFGHAPQVTIDRRLASFWFASTLRPQGWQPPSVRDPITGDYATRDGWIRVHANAPHHRDAALAVLGCSPEQSAVSQAISRYQARELEDMLVAAGACAAAMRTPQEWADHPQGKAVAAEPVFAVQRYPARSSSRPQPASHNTAPDETDGMLAPAGTALSNSPFGDYRHLDKPVDLVTPDRPLAGLRVLDLTRVLAGPVCTRFLAGYGAQILRIDPPFWNEPGLEPEMTLGKRCASLDLRIPSHMAQLRSLLADADVLVHGYRPDALARLGLGEAERQAIRPGLIDVCLDAYGWTGPWQHRRGFDSLVQMSCGIAWAGMAGADGRTKDGLASHTRTQASPPAPLPLQALDHATGYLMAAAVLRALSEQMGTECGCVTRLSLARTACLLMSQPAQAADGLAPESEDDWAQISEATSWGPAYRLKPPCIIDDVPLYWDSPATALRTHAPTWQSQP
ncbi:CoA transferase [Pusillimonas sp. ANT_WB101]|uniref:CoA transferase n=1 Tax=Pusillimonas sp. ANT_WB101 TaxID=2597356 RepID=UPI0021074136|nr:CoA transferase [Pusillimonas sp. ANT_WB101]